MLLAIQVCAGLAAAATALIVLRRRALARRDTSARSSERLVVVTGCDSGLGALLVRELAAEGFVVVAACLGEGAAKAISRPGQIVGVAGDLTQSVDALLGAVMAALGSNPGLQLWAIVNNAGICLPGNAEWLSPEAYERTLAVNFHVPVRLTYELLPLLKRTRNARVVNVTSVDGFIALPTNPAYNSSKHALEAFSDTLRCEMLPWGVRVAVVEPGTMRTPLAMSYMDGWIASFEAAPASRTEDVYGRAWADGVRKAMSEALEKAAEDPRVAVRDLVHACTALNPRTRYKCGVFAKTVWTVLAHLPDNMRDRTLHSMTFPGTPKALAAGAGAP